MSSIKNIYGFTDTLLHIQWCQCQNNFHLPRLTNFYVQHSQNRSKHNEQPETWEFVAFRKRATFMLLICRWALTHDKIVQRNVERTIEAWTMQPVLLNNLSRVEWTSDSTRDKGKSLRASPVITIREAEWKFTLFGLLKLLSILKLFINSTFYCFSLFSIIFIMPLNSLFKMDKVFVSKSQPKHDVW